MGNKNTFGSSHIQTDLHTAIRSKSHTREYAGTRKFAWLSLHYPGRNNNFQMGETVKVIINYIGITTYILGILANINNLLSVLLACVGVVWGFVKCLEKWEDYQIKKWERRQREDEDKKKRRWPKAS